MNADKRRWTRLANDWNGVGSTHDRTTVRIPALGIARTYLANIIRMAIIVIVGYYYGMDALLWTHANMGWLIFLGMDGTVLAHIH